MLTQHLAEIKTLTHDGFDDESEELFEDPFHDKVSILELAMRKNRRWDKCKWDGGFKIEISKSNGGLQLEEFINWFYTIEQILGFKDIPDLKRLN